MTATVTVLRTKDHFKRLHRGFNLLRSADERSVVAAYRWGEIVYELHEIGYSWDELGEEVDRTWQTVRLYAKLFHKYESEKALLETARAMKTYAVARLAGHISLTPVVYVFTCNNCGASDVSKHKKDEDHGDPEGTVAPVAFRAPISQN